MLDHDLEAAELYDLRTRDLAADLPAILELASTYGGRTLELGCGTGRVLRALASAGHHALTGVDSSPGAIAVARRSLPAATLTVGEMQAFRAAEQFDVVLVAFNTIELLPSLAEVLSTLRLARQHCRSGGAVFIDTRPATFDSPAPEPESPLRRLRQLSDPTRGQVDVFFRAKRDAATRQSHCSMLYRWTTPTGDRTLTADYTVRPLTVDELMLSLQLTGFSIMSARGDYRNAPFEPRIHQQLTIVATPAFA